MSDVLIIGGGVSGLVAGVYARLSGHNAIICEQHSVVGGFLTSWKRMGYTIDGCIHWLTGTNPNSNFYRIWRDVNAINDDVVIEKHETLFTVEENGNTCSLFRSIKRTIEQMIAISPEDKKEIHSFGKVMEFIHGTLNGWGENNDKKMPIFKFISDFPDVIKYWGHSIGEIASKFKSTLLQKFMTSLLGTNFSSLAFGYVAGTFTSANADIPKGYSLPMAERMKQRFLELGGQILTKHKAIKINSNGNHVNSVDFENGKSINCDYVVFCTDPYSVFGKLINAKLPRKLEKQLLNREYRYFSGYNLELIIDKPNLPFEGTMFLNVPEDLRKTIGNTRISFRNYCPDGYATSKGQSQAQVIVYCGGRESKKFVDLSNNDKDAYNEYKRAKKEAIIELINRRYPELIDSYRVIDMWTPATYARYTGTVMGTFQPFTMPKKALPIPAKNTIKEFDNVILGSQWQIAPGGLPTAAMSGKNAIATVDRLSKKQKHCN